MCPTSVPSPCPPISGARPACRIWPLQLVHGLPIYLEPCLGKSMYTYRPIELYNNNAHFTSSSNINPARPPQTTILTIAKLGVPSGPRRPCPLSVASFTNGVNLPYVPPEKLLHLPYLPIDGFSRWEGIPIPSERPKAIPPAPTWVCPARIWFLRCERSEDELGCVKFLERRVTFLLAS